MKKLFAFLFLILIFATPVYGRIPDAEVYLPICETTTEHGWEVEWHRAPNEILLTSPVGEKIFLHVKNDGGIIFGGKIYFPAITLNEILILPDDNSNEGIGIHGKLTRVRHGENTAYIFGSMHAGRAEWFPLHPIAEDAMSRADVFAFEIDFKSDLSDEDDDEIFALMTLPDELTLGRVLTGYVFMDFYNNLKTYHHLGITYDMIKHLTPAALLHDLSYAVLRVRGIEREYAIDDYIYDYAEENDRPIIGLTSIIQQYRNVFDVPLEIQAYALYDFPDFQTWFDSEDDDELTEAYETQNIEALREMFIYEPGDWQPSPYDEFMSDRHLNVRNLHFSNEIARLLRETEEPTIFFITVGMWHIIGGDGGGQVLVRLENEGFELTPLWS